MVKDIHEAITPAKFGDDCLRGLGVVAGQISAFPIDFDGRPDNTFTLPCDRVIPMNHCTRLPKQRQCRRSKMPYMISSRSVIDGVSLSVSH